MAPIHTTSFPSAKPLATVHRLSPATWLLELHNDPDNRLTTHFIKEALHPALDLVEKEWRASPNKPKGATHPEGALIISGNIKQDKFYSNGLDYEKSMAEPGFFPNVFNPFIARILLFPIPTIACINGHAFAGGWLLALACDYRVMLSPPSTQSRRKVWGSMNEVHFGAPFPRPFAVLMRVKGSSPEFVRKLALEGHRFTTQELFEHRMIESMAETSEGLIRKATQVAERVQSIAKMGGWGLIKKDLYYDVAESLKEDARPVMPAEMDALARARL